MEQSSLWKNEGLKFLQLNNQDAPTLFLSAQRGDQPVRFQQEVQGGDDIDCDEITAGNRLRRGTFRTDDADSQNGFLQHQSVICAVSHGNGGIPAQLPHQPELLLLFIARMEDVDFNTKLLAQFPSLTLGIRRDDDDVDQPAQQFKSFGNPFDDGAVQGNRPVKVQDQVLESVNAPSGDVNLYQSSLPRDDFSLLFRH